MKYTPQQLRDIAPLLTQQVAHAPVKFKARGTQLLRAIETVTRCADILAPIVGDEIGDVASSYLLPQIHSYLHEVAGHSATPIVFQFAPAALLGAQHAGLFEKIGKLFGAQEGFD